MNTKGLSGGIYRPLSADGIAAIHDASLVIDADIAPQYRALALFVVVEVGAVQPEAALILVRVVVLKDGCPCRAPVCVERGAVIGE